MNSKAQYVVKQINNVSINDRYTVSRILLIRNYNLIQSNNGAYIHIEYIYEETLNEIYMFVKTKLSLWFELIIFIFVHT